VHEAKTTSTDTHMNDSVCGTRREWKRGKKWGESSMFLAMKRILFW